MKATKAHAGRYVQIHTRTLKAWWKDCAILAQIIRSTDQSDPTMRQWARHLEKLMAKIEAAREPNRPQGEGTDERR